MWERGICHSFLVSQNVEKSMNYAKLRHIKIGLEHISHLDTGFLPSAFVHILFYQF